jgi:hypothetical protein
MKKLPEIAEAAGIAAIVFYPLYAGLLENVAAVRMHSSAPVTNFALAIIANLVFMAVVLSLLQSWISEKRKAAWLRPCLPCIVVSSLSEMVYIYIVHQPSRRLLVGVFLLTLVFTLILRKKSQRSYEGALGLCKAALVGLGVFSIFVTLQLARLALWRPAPDFIDGKSTASVYPSGSHPRVVWILMDELSYNQVFGQRVPDLELPYFDAFRQTSTLFTDVQPATEDTETAVPSLLLGRLVDHVTYTSANRYLAAAPGQTLRPFPASETPFALAQRQGMTTSVIGWYNPYCTMLAPYLNQCYWNSNAEFPATFIMGDGFWRSVTDVWVRYWIALDPHHKRRGLIYMADAYRDLTQRAEEQFAQSQPDFVFLHLPLPHPPGFYDRRTGQFDASGQRSYLDNLVLADKTLGQLVSVLQASPRWSNTSIVLCGDHSWRTMMWRQTRHWTSEDEAVSHGGIFDPRPMLMVHQPGQHTPRTVSQPFPLVGVHDILDSQILSQQPSIQ